MPVCVTHLRDSFSYFKLNVSKRFKKFKMEYRWKVRKKAIVSCAWKPYLLFHSGEELVPLISDYFYWYMRRNKNASSSKNYWSQIIASLQNIIDPKTVQPTWWSLCLQQPAQIVVTMLISKHELHWRKFSLLVEINKSFSTDLWKTNGAEPTFQILFVPQK